MLSSDIPAAAIGTALTAVGPAVAAGAIRTLIGLRCSNGSQTQPIAVTVFVKRGTVYAPLVPYVTVRAGGAVEGLTGSKIVLMPGDQLFAQSSVAGSLWVFASYDESPNA